MPLLLKMAEYEYDGEHLTTVIVVKPLTHEGINMTSNVSQSNAAAHEMLQYCTVQQIVNDRSFCFTEPTLRYHILYAHKNGLDKAIRRLGRKVLIRRDLFINWIEKQNQK